MPDDRDTSRGSKPKRAKGSAKGPKLAENTAYDVLRQRMISITIGGKEREVSAISAAKHRTFQAALNGDRMAHREVRRWIREREAARPSAQRQLPLILAECPCPADVNQALILLSLAEALPGLERAGGLPFLQLEPWIVQQALARRGSNRLAASEIAEVRQHTRPDDRGARWEASSE